MKTWAVSICFLFLNAAFGGTLYANELLTGDHYVGSWQTTRVHHQFTHARSIMFELWKSADGKPEGVGIFLTGHGECWGPLSFNETIGKLQFTSTESSACQDLPGGHYGFL